MFALIGAGAWLAVPAPRLDWRRRSVRGFARALLRLTGIPLRVQGAERLPPAQECCVLVSNHASYLDSIVLSAALARPFGFVTKAELAGRFGLRVPQPVGRALCATRRPAAGHRRRAAPGRGGPCGRIPGVFPGRNVHERTRTAAVPSGRLRRGAGSRGSGRPHRHPRHPCHPVGRQLVSAARAVIVTIGPSLRTDDDAGQPASAWQAAVAFRNRARAYIVSHCGEPDLAGAAAPHAPSPP